MDELNISPAIVTQLTNGKSIRFTHSGGQKEEIGYLNLSAVPAGKYTAQVIYSVTERGITQSKSTYLNQQQFDTIGWSDPHNSFIGRF